MPKGDDSHLVLFEMFCPDVQNTKPEFIIFTEDIKEGLVILRRFRHFARHGYAFHLDWERLQMGLKTVENLFSVFRNNLLRNFNIRN